MHQCLLQTCRFTQVLALFIFASIICQEFYTYFPKFLRLCSLSSVDSYFSRKSGTMCQFFDKHGYPVPVAPKLTLITKSYTLVKQEDDQVTNFKNSFAMQKETTRTHPVIRHLNLPNHSKQHMAVCCLSLLLGSSEGSKTLEKKIIFQIGTLNHHSINKPFSFNQFILVLSLLYSHSQHSSIFCI